jgi:ABC-type sugar transport system permease subunit
MKLRDNDHIVGYVFVSPFIMGFLVFTLFPMLSSLYFSFTNYDMMTEPSWVGFDNYIKMFSADKDIAQSFKVTFTYVFAAVPLRLAFALLVAMMLNSPRKGIGLYRTTYYLPSLIGGSVAVSIMWVQIFGDKGLFNAILGLFGIHTDISWIGYPISAFMTFTPAYIISNGEGGPLGHTLLYSLYLFRRAFVFFEMGYASAMAWVMLVIIGLITLVIFKTSSYWVHYEGKGGK